ncbi:MAG TPA: bifunctional 2-polyprenyl-6-hydroxyphenol methylase/3-demethylubiquinol 3-O-methyltransferase UbiG, partial [Chthoniobacterales bacterium]
NRPLFLSTAAHLVRPGGLLILSTLNRTLKSFALAIVGAEWVLRWLPRGTHSWEKFVTPEELTQEVRAQNFAIFDRTGMTYNPLFGEWRLSEDCDVNYFVAAEKPM